MPNNTVEQQKIGWSTSKQEGPQCTNKEMILVRNLLNKSKGTEKTRPIMIQPIQKGKTCQDFFCNLYYIASNSFTYRSHKINALYE